MICLKWVFRIARVGCATGRWCSRAPRQALCLTPERDPPGAAYSNAVAGLIVPGGSSSEWLRNNSGAKARCLSNWRWRWGPATVGLNCRLALASHLEIVGAKRAKSGTEVRDPALKRNLQKAAFQIVDVDHFRGCWGIACCTRTKEGGLTWHRSQGHMIITKNALGAVPP